MGIFHFGRLPFWSSSILVIFYFGRLPFWSSSILGGFSSFTLKVLPCGKIHRHTDTEIKSQFNPQQKLTFVLWSSLAIVTSTSLSSADIFTSSSVCLCIL